VIRQSVCNTVCTECKPCQAKNPIEDIWVPLPLNDGLMPEGPQIKTVLRWLLVPVGEKETVKTPGFLSRLLVLTTGRSSITCMVNQMEQDII